MVDGHFLDAEPMPQFEGCGQRLRTLGMTACFDQTDIPHLEAEQNGRRKPSTSELGGNGLTFRLAEQQGGESGKRRPL